MSQYINGRDFIVEVEEVDGSFKTVCCGRNFSIDINTDLDEATLGCAGNFKEWLPSYTEWGFNFEGVTELSENTCYNNFDLLNFQINRTPLIFRGDVDGVGHVVLSGTFYLQSHNVTGNVDDSVNFTAVGKGTGILTVAIATDRVYYGTQAVSTTPVSFTDYISTVTDSNITVDYGVVSMDKFFYMAHPSTSSEKDLWQDVQYLLNSGEIGAITDLFEVRSISIASVPYKLYITRYATNFNGSKVRYYV